MITTVKAPKICHVVASINENIGGPAYSVTSLANALSQHDIAPCLFTLDYRRCGSQVATQDIELHSYEAFLLTEYLRGFQPNAKKALCQLAATKLNLIHNHGLWMFPNLYARLAAVDNHLPLLISPRGMLETWSLKNSWFKKLPAWLLYEQQNLKSASVFHATSLEEAASIRKLGFRQPIALIPNGITIPDLDNQPNREVLVNLFPELASKKWLLFLSRIHPKKGLDNLLYTWKSLKAQFPTWHLVIAGPDLIGYRVKLEQLTRTLGLKQHVTFTGMLSGEYKASALNHADLFVLPTHSENFGIAIAESLSYGVPVITTQGTPWQDIERYQCGWWIENNQQTLTTVLGEAMQLSNEQRKVMGLRGRHLVETHYSWNHIAQEMANVYRWMLYGEELPTCIQLYKGT